MDILPLDTGMFPPNGPCGTRVVLNGTFPVDGTRTVRFIEVKYDVTRVGSRSIYVVRELLKGCRVTNRCECINSGERMGLVGRVSLSGTLGLRCSF